MTRKPFLPLLVKALLWRTAATVLLTLSLWGTIFVYNWTGVHLGESYAFAFGWASGVTALCLVLWLLGAIPEHFS